MTALCLKPIFLQETTLGTPGELARFLAEVERRAFRQALYAVQDEDAALDIVQDAMLRLADKYPTRPATEWPMLFQRILQNAVRDYYRRQKVRSWWTTLISAFQPHDDEADASDPLEWLPHTAEAPPTPHEELDQARTMQIIEVGLKKLPARQREAFLLRYWEEMDVAETARVMGCSEGSVKTHCSRATHALAAWLREQGVES
ncbi:MAG: RNA polymerase sigma factor [Formivibrio sp.]|nr:RNA polymerase sigma factor [Formivibrio sp.]